MRDRSTQVDLALAFAATFVITLAVWPQTSPRQIVRCNVDEQGWKTYSIAIDDPSLEELKEKIHRWKTPESHPKYVTAKWQKEVAEFYENCEPCQSNEPAKSTPRRGRYSSGATASISDTVTTASYETELDDLNGESGFGAVHTASHVEPAEISDAEPAASPSDANYWATVKASAVESMQAIEQRSANVPMVFEEVTRPTWPQLAFHFAFLLSIAAACGYMHWLRYAPLQSGTSFHDQPIRVLARIGTFSGGIGLALISAVVVWI